MAKNTINFNHVLPDSIEELLAFFETDLETLRFSDNEIKLIWVAYNYARTAHDGQKRDSGEPFVIHPLHTAKTLVDLGFDTESICAGLLHDVVEDTEITTLQIEEQFGEVIANLVDGVTKLMQYDTSSAEQRDVQGIRKLFMAMITDPRVIVIKLADRLHNLQTINYRPIESQRACLKNLIRNLLKLNGALSSLMRFAGGPSSFSSIQVKMSVQTVWKQK